MADAIAHLRGNGYEPLPNDYNPLDIDEVRERLHERGEMAVMQLCYAVLDHAADSITHTDQKLGLIYKHSDKETLKRLGEKAGHVSDAQI